MIERPSSTDNYNSNSYRRIHLYLHHKVDRNPELGILADPTKDADIMQIAAFSEGEIGRGKVLANEALYGNSEDGIDALLRDITPYFEKGYILKTTVPESCADVEGRPGSEVMRFQLPLRIQRKIFSRRIELAKRRQSELEEVGQVSKMKKTAL